VFSLVLERKDVKLVGEKTRKKDMLYSVKILF